MVRFTVIYLNEVYIVGKYFHMPVAIDVFPCFSNLKINSLLFIIYPKILSYCVR